MRPGGPDWQFLPGLTPAEGELVIHKRASDAFYDEPLSVPWFDFALTKHDGLLQVVTHSTQHRAQVCSVLGQHGVEVPNLDYVFLVESGRPRGA